MAASSPQGRFAESAARIDGTRLLRVEAWGKHLFTRFDGGDLLHVHLGLFGRFTVHDSLPPPPPTGAVRLRLTGARGALDLQRPDDLPARRTRPAATRSSPASGPIRCGGTPAAASASPPGCWRAGRRSGPC